MAESTTAFDMQNVVTASMLESILNAQLDAMDRNPDIVDVMAPLHIVGSPGCGKSSIVRSVCEKRGIEFIDFRASQCEPCDIRGLPVPNRENKCMDWFVNGIWPRNPEGKGVIFLDELDAADRSIQVSLCQLILDRNLGELYKVPRGYLIVAAGNLTTDKAVATTMSSALANRFTHVTLREDAESWCDWARENGVNSSVIGFINYKPSMLFNMEGENVAKGWPTPRSWARVSTICDEYNVPEDVLRVLIYGTVGNGAGLEFMEFYKTSRKFANILDVMRDPDAKFEMPEKADELHAVCSAMTYLMWRGKDAEDQQA